MNNNPKKRRFLEEKGFYIILFLCAAAIGIAGYVLFAQPSDNDTALDAEEVETDYSSIADIPSIDDSFLTDNPVLFDDDDDEVFIPEDEADVPVSDHTAEDETLADAEESCEDEAVEVSAEQVTAPEETAEETVKKKEEPEKEPTFFVKPVSGEILKSFNITELVYDRTMGDWRTHNGIDIGAANGDTVAAIADGCVAGVYNDSYYGTCVRIEHSGGLESIYYGLAENATVKVGDSVKAGDTIGSVSTDIMFESLEPVHLHLEVKRGGELIDPAQLLPE